MIDTNAFKASYNSFDFNFKTSSGDKISLSMYDNKEMSMSHSQENNKTIDSFTLKHSFGYRFSYSGDGLDENDKKEIAKALEKVDPNIKTFMENVDESGIPSPRSILNFAQDIGSQLPRFDDENKKSALQSGLLELFDINLHKYFPNEDVLLSSKNLFDKINEQIENFLLYV